MHHFKTPFFILTTFCLCLSAQAGLLPLHSQGKEILQVSIEGLYADQSNNLPILYGFTPLLERGSNYNFDNPYALLGDNIFLDPEETWGFGANIGYVFASHQYDIQFSYFGIDSERSQSTLGTIPDGYPVSVEPDEEFNFNSADIMFGRYFFPTNALTLRGSVGITFADIDQENHVFLGNIGNPGNATAHVKNVFIGAGPKIQITGTFDIVKYVAIIGDFGLGTLLGEAETKNDISQNENPAFQDEYHDEDHKIAVEIDSKLGLLFAHTIGDKNSVNVEAGYKFVTYLNALQDEPIQQVTMGDLLFFQADADYFYSGPYVMLGVNFM